MLRCRRRVNPLVLAVAIGVDMAVATASSAISERLYNQLRSDIIFARLEPGRRLRLDRLAQDYGASVSTLRETLNRLSSEGLVAAEGQRGFGVATVSQGEFEEIAALRLLLEQHAIALSFAAGDVEWEGNVAAAHHKLEALERLMLSGDRAQTETWKHYDREFHQALIAACGSDALIDLYGQIYDRYLRYQIVAVVFRGTAAADEHRALLDCALRRDAAGACTILRRHIDDCVAHTRAVGVLASHAIGPAATDVADVAETVTEGAYRHIRADILTGHLAPGAKLKLDILRGHYDTSVSTLREVLNRLTAERLVVAEGQKGFQVAPVSAANLRELAAVRQLLESHALAQSFKAGDIEWEGRVVAAHHKLSRLEAQMAAGDLSAIGAWRRYDCQFHQALISACGSRTLIQAHAANFDKYLRYQMTTLTNRGDISSGEHHQLLDCALNRDWQTATAVLHRHLDGGVAHALAHVPALNADTTRLVG